MKKETYSLAPQPLARRIRYLKSFVLFQEFPVEIKLKIFRAMAHIPRTVAVSLKEIGRMPMSEEPIFKYVSPMRPPAILQVCQAAREEALKFYRLEFDLKYYGPSMALFLDGTIYVNFKVDIIMPRGAFTAQIFEDFCKQDIRHMAVSVFPFESSEDLPRSLLQNKSFKYLRLETLTVCHATCFEPLVPIDWDVPPVLATKSTSALSAKDSLYGLVRTSNKYMIK